MQASKRIGWYSLFYTELILSRASMWNAFHVWIDFLWSELWHFGIPSPAISGKARLNKCSCWLVKQQHASNSEQLCRQFLTLLGLTVQDTIARMCLLSEFQNMSRLTKQLWNVHAPALVVSPVTSDCSTTAGRGEASVFIKAWSAVSGAG